MMKTKIQINDQLDKLFTLFYMNCRLLVYELDQMCSVGCTNGCRCSFSVLWSLCLCICIFFVFSIMGYLLKRFMGGLCLDNVDDL